LSNHDADVAKSFDQRLRRDTGIDTFDHQEIALRGIHGDLQAGVPGHGIEYGFLVRALQRLDFAHPLVLDSQCGQRAFLRNHA
jgi:hypothetical protein